MWRKLAVCMVALALVVLPAGVDAQDWIHTPRTGGVEKTLNANESKTFQAIRPNEDLLGDDVTRYDVRPREEVDIDTTSIQLFMLVSVACICAWWCRKRGS